jgi:hypothetical protein
VVLSPNSERNLAGLVGVVLIAATILTFMLIGLANSADWEWNQVASTLYVLAYVAVLVIIVDRDQPQKVQLNVSQDALTDLLEQMTRHAP